MRNSSEKPSALFVANKKLIDWECGIVNIDG